MTPTVNDAKCATLINVFTVAPEKQRQLVALLIDLTQKSIRYLPGFISGDIHRSLDGTRVTIYGQWRSLDDLKNMVKIRASISQMQEALNLTTGVDAKVYEVVEVCNVDMEKKHRSMAWLGM